MDIDDLFDVIHDDPLFGAAASAGGDPLPIADPNDLFASPHPLDTPVTSSAFPPPLPPTTSSRPALIDGQFPTVPGGSSYERYGISSGSQSSTVPRQQPPSGFAVDRRSTLDRLLSSHSNQAFHRPASESQLRPMLDPTPRPRSESQFGDLRQRFGANGNGPPYQHVNLSQPQPLRSTIGGFRDDRPGPSWRHEDAIAGSSAQQPPLRRWHTDDEPDDQVVTFGGLAVKSQRRRQIRHIMSDSRLSASALEAQRCEKERLVRLKRRRVAANVVDLVDDDDDEETPHTDDDEHDSSTDTIKKTGDLDDSVIPPDPCPSTSSAAPPTNERRPSEEAARVDLESIYTADGRMIVNAGHPPNEPDVFINDCLTKYLKPHQLEGVRFMYENIIESPDGFRDRPGFGCVLAHSMGLGKTLQVITFVDIVFRYTDAKCALVLVPVNTLQNWLKEFNRWLPPIVAADHHPDQHDAVGGRSFQVRYSCR